MKATIVSTFALASLVYGFAVTAIEAKAAVITWNFEDDFSTEKATILSYDHSIFWPEMALPPPEPYLYYTNFSFPQGMLAFAGYSYEEEGAYLAYAFPLFNIMTRIDSGTVELDILSADFDEANPPLSYVLSEEGINWAEPVPLVEGHNQISLLPSDYQHTYVKFIGTGVAIDNLFVTVSGPEIPEPASLFLLGIGFIGLILKRRQNFKRYPLQSPLLRISWVCPVTRIISPDMKQSQNLCLLHPKFLLLNSFS
jgi:hypothetical protein